MHRLKLKSLLGRIVGWSQWEGTISLFILGLGGAGRFFFAVLSSSSSYLFIYLFVFRDCPFLVFGARGGKKGAILWTVANAMWGWGLR